MYCYMEWRSIHALIFKVLETGNSTNILLALRSHVGAGYQPELAYFEACNEAKLVMDLICQAGVSIIISFIMYRIS
ncbi:MAG: hypothetical protein JSW14_05880 [Candidatus Bathyarchaeum sp.]|nr:MAG: hypothetical protein JSW14_05880 [Candidatus Bathyarchaeum sp.]